MIRKSRALHWVRSWSLLCAIVAFAWNPASAADAYDAAVAHAGRSDADLKRDPLDHPADTPCPTFLRASRLSENPVLARHSRCSGC